MRQGKPGEDSLYFLWPSPKSPATVSVALSVKYSIINWSQNAFWWLSGTWKERGGGGGGGGIKQRGVELEQQKDSESRGFGMCCGDDLCAPWKAGQTSSYEYHHNASTHTVSHTHRDTDLAIREQLLAECIQSEVQWRVALRSCSVPAKGGREGGREGGRGGGNEEIGAGGGSKEGG